MRLTFSINNLTSALVFLTALTSIATAQNICQLYPTRCAPYSGPQAVGPLGLPGYPGASPIYTPSTLAPAMGMVVRDALNSLPEGVRQALYPPQVAKAVRSGVVDAAIERSLRTGFDPYAAILNGTGPGGAYYTNQAAMAVMNGTSPIWQLGSAMSPYAAQLERNAQVARQRQLEMQLQQKLREMQQSLAQRAAQQAARQ